MCAPGEEERKPARQTDRRDTPPPNTYTIEIRTDLSCFLSLLTNGSAYVIHRSSSSFSSSSSASSE
ncbi:hypothetical protein E2C01_067017 [Portunus trituberculatus]|uniref:Uncharacterized protein n=1 Tax=Portunus trituberculatus TaxID=210409 RepID=A0A5B7HSI1_PORTR|nr:hypothetical protein [Portunus trituberculatus]